jgi:AraC family ethanolamine operon transcriptional activator
MRQMSRGTMKARIHVGLVGEILATREHWSHQIVGRGVTPAGYLALAGTGPAQSFRWCGHEVDSRHLVCGLDAAECDFATPDGEVHWVLLIPRELLAHYLDPKDVERLGERRILRCEPRVANRFFDLANRAIQPSYGAPPSGLDALATKVLRAELLETAAQLLSGENGRRKPSSRRLHYQLCRRAVAAIDSLRRPVNVPDLASEVGVSRRTLERAFQDTLGLSPYKYSRFHRLNRLHRNLLAARNHERNVTELLTRWGFTELGRTAVEYKRLFGESPSTTLAAEPGWTSYRLADALNSGSASTSANP